MSEKLSTRPDAEAAAPAQDLGEQSPRHRHLGELENHVPPHAAILLFASLAHAKTAPT